MKHTTRTAATLAVGATLLAATACGSPAAPDPARAAGAPAASSAAAPSADALDPCTLLDDDTLGSALGARLRGGGTAEARAGGLSCTWTYDDPGSAVGEGQLVLTTFHGTEFFAPGSIGAPLPGLADEAQIDRGLGLVLFRSGEEVVEVHVLSGGFRDRAEPVARAVAAAL